MLYRTLVYIEIFSLYSQKKKAYSVGKIDQVVAWGIAKKIHRSVSKENNQIGGLLVLQLWVDGNEYNVYKRYVTCQND